MNRKIYYVLLKTKFLLLLFFVVSCNFKNKLKSDQIKVLSFSDSICQQITNVKYNEGFKKVLVFNDNIVVSPDCLMLYESHHPKWIFEKTRSIEEYKGIKLYYPKIVDVDAPFKIVKCSNSNYFYVKKNNDTLIFLLDEFDNENPFF